MEDAMKIWNGYVHEHKELSYKLIEDLKMYFNGDWKSQANTKQ